MELAELFSVASRFVPREFRSLPTECRELYLHAGLPREWAELRPGRAEALIGAVLRVLPASDPRWRRVWAAWSVTRTIRKPICPGVEEERHVREWFEWGMGQ